MEGVIRVPLAPVRFEPSDRAEMVTQALFGELLDLELVEGQPNWAKVHLHFDGCRQAAGFLAPRFLTTTQPPFPMFWPRPCSFSEHLTCGVARAFSAWTAVA